MGSAQLQERFRQRPRGRLGIKAQSHAQLCFGTFIAQCADDVGLDVGGQLIDDARGFSRIQSLDQIQGQFVRCLLEEFGGEVRGSTDKTRSRSCGSRRSNNVTLFTLGNRSDSPAQFAKGADGRQCGGRRGRAARGPVPALHRGRSVPPWLPGPFSARNARPSIEAEEPLDTARP